MKTIWVINHYGAPPKYSQFRRTHELSKQYVKHGYNVRVICSSTVHNKDIDLLEEHENIKTETVDLVEYTYIKTKGYSGNGLSRILNMIDFSMKVLKLKREKVKPDLIIGSAQSLISCYSAYRLSKKYKCKFILEIRDLWPETLIQFGNIKRNSIIARGFRLLERYLYKRAHAIVTTAPNMEKYFTSVLKLKKYNKVVCINNGVDYARFVEESYNEPVIKFGPGFNCVYNGSIGNANELHDLIEAAKILKEMGISDVNFHFVGQGPETGNLRQLARRYELDNIIFHGGIKQKDVPAVLVQADLLLITMKNIQLYEYGISLNKIFEYLASGRPILFSGNVYNDLVSESGSGFSIKPNNPKLIAETILSAMNLSREELDLMGNKGIDFVKKHYDFTILGKKYIDLIEEIIDIEKGKKEE